MELLKVPPHNMNAEMAVVGAMIMDPECTYKAKSINKDWFYRNIHQVMFETMIEMNNDAKPIDMITLMEELNKKDMAEHVGGFEYINECTTAGIITSNFDHYVNIIRNLSKKRMSICKAAEIMDLAYDHATEPQMLDKLYKDAMDEMTRYNPHTNFMHIKDVALNTIDIMEKDHESDITGIPTGYEKFDKMVTLKDNNLMIVSAPPGAGKTTWVTNLVEHMGDHHTVGFIAFEQTKEAIVEKMLLSKAMVRSSYIRRDKDQMKAHHWSNIMNAGSILSNKKIFLEDASNKNILQIRESIMALKKEHGVDVIVIDYLQLIKDHTSGDKKERLDDKIRELIALKKELGILIICISSMNRNQNARANKRPVMSDLEGSGLIEYSADQIVFIYRESMYDDEPKEEHTISADPVEIIIAKQKEGPTGMVKQYFIKENGRFRE